MVIETEKLLLREYMIEDYDSLYEIMSDAETMQHYLDPKNEISYAFAITREEWEKLEKL